MHQSLGIIHFWAQSDLLIRSVAILLLLMSVISWQLILAKLLTGLLARMSITRAIEGFWSADSRTAALKAVQTADRTGLFALVAREALRAAQAYEEKTAGGIGAGVGAGEFIGRSLQQSMLMAQARLERGLTFLASVGSTAPFVGLFGTVWGIYHALVGLAGSSQVVLDRVAGPVGEALIMTAAGLFVAIPAVLAYNAFTRSNRLVLAQLDGFAHGLHAYLAAGVRLDEQARGGKVTALRTAAGR
jgi:biopolymer transport protein ExbB